MSNNRVLERAILSLEHMAVLSQKVLQAIQKGNHPEIRKKIDSYRTALSLFDVDANLLKSVIKAKNLSSTEIKKLEGYFEINKIVDNVINNFITSKINFIKSEHSKKNIHFESFDDLIDIAIPKIWNYSTDLVFLQKGSPPELIDSLKNRGQKRIFIQSENYKKIEDNIFQICHKTTSKALENFDFPLPKRLCFLNKTISLSKVHLDEYYQISETLKEDLRVITSHLSTVRRFQRSWIINSLNNLKFFGNAFSVENLRGYFEKRKVIIVSPGPSLDKNIHLLANAKNCIIVAVAQAVQALHQNNIVPDFIFVMDSQDYSHVLEGIDLSATSLICLDYVSPNFLKFDFFNKFIVFTSNSVTYVPFFSNFEKVDMTGASSVSVGATLLSEWLGADTIALVGQDLSFKEQKYFNNYFIEGNVKDESGREPNITNDILVDGYNGGKVRTIYQYSIYIKQFEALARNINNKSGVRLYNCTEGGAYIDGFVNLRLSKFIEKHVDGRILSYPFDISTILNTKNVHIISGLINKVREDIGSICKDTYPQNLLRGIKRDKYFEGKLYRKIFNVQFLSDSLRFNELIKLAECLDIGFGEEIILKQKLWTFEDIYNHAFDFDLLLKECVETLPYLYE